MELSEFGRLEELPTLSTGLSRHLRRIEQC